MNFITYDLIFLFIFAIIIGKFLYQNKRKVKKEGALLLYKTKWGIKLINYVGKKYKKTLSILSYFSVITGYFLMAGIIYLFGKLVWVYMVNPSVVKAIKIPPIMPLVPYLPQMFKLNFLPPFYFTYWILILIIVAIPHEFAHGIFMRLFKVKIKTTGFGFFPFFFPIFPLAFVEQNEKSMQKASKFKQMAILSAGTFANVLTAFLFLLILWGFFSAAFTPAGVVFNDYSYSIVGLSTITSINNISVQNISYDKFISLAKNSSYNYIEAGGKEYVGVKGFTQNKDLVVLYNSAPAIKNNLSGAIVKINGIPIKNINELGNELKKYSVGEKINITTELNKKRITKELVLGEHPNIKGRAWLGIGFINNEKTGIINKIITKLSSFKKPHTYYISKIGGLGLFIYNLLWWIILISFSVAFLNMLPVGIFDGGRFFHLTIWGLTKNEKFADKSFKFVTWLFLLVVLILMVFWLKAFF